MGDKSLRKNEEKIKLQRKKSNFLTNLWITKSISQLMIR